ncbi:Hsp20/alpha crystallin family protein [Glaciimonas immobilis]|uniref:HSP20 family protein n=1 Tax=Glaciimonas immobilis TaxID=728004 RepID=A0A840RU76_9BURK|nr:Hsp20/alpha crystallin family protein [Glaciimonas immobilis]KAF3997687.1 Hsp20/alpha crystallin family protein [Glaciimonas immobilis]MBB5200598.1 HSP20 family protein [Glaciimonas immobilis]
MFSSSIRLPGGFLAEFGDIRRQFEQLLGTVGSPSSIRAVRRGAFPSINMGTTDAAVEIYALAPGIDPSQLEVSVDKGLLIIAGSRKSAVPSEKQEKLNVYASERFTGEFKRVLSLPEDVDSENVSATYKNGILRVVVPKRESRKPRRIEVNNVS